MVNKYDFMIHKSKYFSQSFMFFMVQVILIFIFLFYIERCFKNVDLL